jgi:hypothetical protein
MGTYARWTKGPPAATSTADDLNMTNTRSSPSLDRIRRDAGRLAFAVVAAHAGASNAAAQTVTYEYVYPYNTPELIENHYIVLDMSGAEPRGWYYGTSDEFDAAREGYLPGFFVASMSDLVVSTWAISFTVERPERFFVSPVPLEYRSAAEVPVGRIEEWNMPLPMASRRYGGAVRSEEIILDMPGGPRAFGRR